jgi:hypothetical protein
MPLRAKNITGDTKAQAKRTKTRPRQEQATSDETCGGQKKRKIIVESTRRQARLGQFSWHTSGEALCCPNKWLLSRIGRLGLCFGSFEEVWTLKTGNWKEAAAASARLVKYALLATFFFCCHVCAAFFLMFFLVLQYFGITHD